MSARVVVAALSLLALADTPAGPPTKPEVWAPLARPDVQRSGYAPLEELIAARKYHVQAARERLERYRALCKEKGLRYQPDAEKWLAGEKEELKWLQSLRGKTPAEIEAALKQEADRRKAEQFWLQLEQPWRLGLPARP